MSILEPPQPKRPSPSTQMAFPSSALQPSRPSVSTRAIDHPPRFGYSFANISLFSAAEQKTMTPSPLHQEKPLPTRIQAAKSGGHPLEEPAQRRLEQGLGTDLSGVRIHADHEADDISRRLDALAFTTGQHIFFRSGSYHPTTSQGMHLLAHEATHILQQATGPVSGIPSIDGLSMSDPEDRFEQAAEANSAQIVAETDEHRRVADGPETPDQSLQLHRFRTSALTFKRQEPISVQRRVLRMEERQALPKGSKEAIDSAEVDASVKQVAQDTGQIIADFYSINSLLKTETEHIVAHAGESKIDDKDLSKLQPLFAARMEKGGAETYNINFVACLAGTPDKGVIQKLQAALAKENYKVRMTGSSEIVILKSDKTWGRTASMYYYRAARGLASDENPVKVSVQKIEKLIKEIREAVQTELGRLIQEFVKPVENVSAEDLREGGLLLEAAGVEHKVTGDKSKDHLNTQQGLAALNKKKSISVQVAAFQKIQFQSVVTLMAQLQQASQEAWDVVSQEYEKIFVKENNGQGFEPTTIPYTKAKGSGESEQLAESWFAYNAPTSIDMMIKSIIDDLIEQSQKKQSVTEV